ncbi:MAG: tail fiber domain-containing protein, partial [Bacteroidota bacterium]
EVMSMKNYKLLLSLLLFVTVTSPLALAQSNSGFSYQAVARDANGALLTEEPITIGFQIRRGTANGILVYAETHDTTTDVFGSFNLTIGSGMPVFGIFSSIRWGDEDFFITTSINGVDAGSAALTSVPYSKLATDMEIGQLKNVVIDTPQNGELIGWDGSAWTNLPFVADGDLEGDFPGPTVVAIQGLEVASDVPSNGQVLVWDETNEKWEPSTITADGSFAAGIGIELDGNIIKNIGDADSTDDVTLTTVPEGDITGRYDSMVVAGIQGHEVSETDPTDGQVLKYNETASAWEPADETAAYTAGSGISILSNVISNTGDADPGDDITETTEAGGDISGTFDALSVTKLRGQDISINAPAEGQVLKWDNTESEWVPGSNGLWSVGINSAATYLEDIEIGAGNASDGDSEYLKIDASTASWYVGVENETNADSSGFFIGKTGTDEDLFHISAAGKVGIGTNNPTHTLHVKHPTGGGFGGGNGLVIENATAATTKWLFYANLGDQLQVIPSSGVGGYFSNVDGSYNIPSDLTLKTNVLSVGAVLPSIMKLEAKSYEYKKSLGNKTIGFIAQDVQILFPELVKQMSTDNGQSLLTLDYAGFGVLALKAIQEQQAVIEKQQKTLEALEARLQALEARINE